MTEDKKPKFFYGYFVVGAAFLIMVVAWGIFYSFGVFFKPVVAEFGWSRAATSGAWSLCVLVIGLLGIVSGRLTDRFGPRIVLTGCGFFLGLGCLLMSQVSAIWQLYLFYGVIIGIGLCGAWVPLLSMVSRWFVKRRGLITGIVASGLGLGTVIIPPLASQLISNYGWRTSYIIVGIMALVVIILAAQFLRRDPSQKGQLPYGENEVKPENSILQAKGFSLREAIHTSQFWMLFAVYLCWEFSLDAIMVHIVPHATDLGISAITAASILAFIGGLSIVGRIGMGGASDRIGNRLAIITCLILMSTILFWLLVAKELWMLYLFAAIFGFAYGGLAVLMSPIVAELFGLRAHGTIFGVVVFGGTIGGAIAPLLAGHIFDITSSYQLAFLTCAVFSSISLILASLLKPTRRGEGGTNDTKRSA